MINTCTIAGRLTQDPEVKETENGKKYCNITLAIQRAYKNKDGIYETDFINITLWEFQAEKFCEYNKKGDLVAVRGSLESYKDEDDKTRLTVKAEKMSFLSMQKNKDDMEER